jgi:putative hydrolase of the HAD superfamily
MTLTAAMLKKGRPLDEIETWIFDLDNTLYPASCNLFVQIEARMEEFIQAEFKLTAEEAHALRGHCFRLHGTTLRGLMNEHRIDPKRFLDFVHEIDLSGVPPDPALVAAIAALPGRKLVFTNGSERHAERLLAHLELTAHFVGIHDIAACQYLPKPDPSGYQCLLARHEIDPRAALMVEDMAKNLVPAAALGMTTAWVPHGAPWASDGLGEHVHHVVEDLAPWLRAVPAMRGGTRG